MSLLEIQEVIDLYHKSVTLIRSELETYSDDYGEEVCVYLNELLLYGEDRYNKLTQDMGEVRELMDNLLDFFATSKNSSPSSDSFGNFFETLWKFAEALEGAWKEVLNNPKKLGKFLPPDTYDFVAISSNGASKKERAPNGERATNGLGAPTPNAPTQKRATAPSVIRRRKPSARAERSAGTEVLEE